MVTGVEPRVIVPGIRRKFDTGDFLMKQKGENSMKKIKEYFSNLTKEQLFLVGFAAALGCVIGMLISPRKTMCCGNANGLNYNTIESEGEEAEIEE